MKQRGLDISGHVKADRQGRRIIFNPKSEA
jgi:hypothetical protein